MFCPNCGKPVIEQDKFCRFCGGALAGTIGNVQASPDLPATSFVPFTTVDSILTINIPKGWQLIQHQIGTLEFLVQNPDSPETIIWSWPVSEFFACAKFMEGVIKFIPGLRDACIPCKEPMDYLKEWSLPHFKKMAGEISEIEFGYFNDPEYRTQMLRSAYCLYERQASGKIVRGKLYSGTQDTGMGMWLGYNSGYQAEKEKFVGLEKMFIFMLATIKIDTTWFQKQQAFQQQIINTYKQSQDETMNIIQSVNANRQAATDRVNQQWNNYFNS